MHLVGQKPPVLVRILANPQISALGSFGSLHCSLVKLFGGVFPLFFPGKLISRCFVSKRLQDLFAENFFHFWC
jgi:hypothetical protein